MANNTVLIGIGNAGCKILSKVNTTIKKIFIDTDKNVVEKYSGLRIGERTCGEYPSLGDLSLGELAIKENKKEILDLIGDIQNVILIAPLGGGTSGGGAKKLIELLQDNNKNVKLLTNIPFDFEGQVKALNALTSITYIEKICEIIKVKKLNLNEITQRMSINEIFDVQDNLYLEKITELLNV